MLSSLGRPKSSKGTCTRYSLSPAAKGGRTEELSVVRAQKTFVLVIRLSGSVSAASCSTSHDGLLLVIINLFHFAYSLFLWRNHENKNKIFNHWSQFLPKIESPKTDLCPRAVLQPMMQSGRHDAKQELHGPCTHGRSRFETCLV